jgi:hypothetical protein
MEKFKLETGQILDQKEKTIMDKANARISEMQTFIE